MECSELKKKFTQHVKFIVQIIQQLDNPRILTIIDKHQIRLLYDNILDFNEKTRNLINYINIENNYEDDIRNFIRNINNKTKKARELDEFIIHN